MKYLNKFLILFFWCVSLHFIQYNFAKANTVNEIIISGNERISNATILMFSDFKTNEIITNDKLDEILKSLYDTNFFENVSIKVLNNKLLINVVELPIIDTIEFEGIKADKMIIALNGIINLKSRSSYNEFLISEDRKNIIEYLKNIGYYFSEVKTVTETLDNNLVKIIHSIDLGNKAKIKKISFLGNKIFKDGKLKNIIISEEYKFWKFISGKKYLNENAINFDKRLLKNFYLNKGFYNVEINTSFAKIVGDEEFELIFNIDANEKIYFNELFLNIPDDFDKSNFNELNKLLQELKGQPYAINKVDDILDQLDKITLNEEYKSITANVDETIFDNKLNLIFFIEETKKTFVEKINIFGNNITRENVIRNNLEIDEGDPFNEILQNKSVNNLKSLNFFRSVESKIIDGKKENSKIINYTVEEKPTGEISAGAGFGTAGGTFVFGIRENNYLGKGVGLDANITLSSESFKGKLGINNPNFNNSDKSLFANIQSLEIDRIKTNGYKTNKTGFEIGTGFEYYDDFRLGLSTRSFYEDIETNSTASTKQQSQAGTYWDTFLNTSFDYDKRNQKFKPDDGFRSRYNIDLPLVSETYTLTNNYSFKKYASLYENNVSSINFYFESANSLKDKDIKLSERLFIPTRLLRGFEKGKVGPKDGKDYIGGNYITTFNAVTSLPVIFENVETFDASLFIDVANVWGVDYDSSIDKSDKIRSSIGIGVDWFSAIGPVNFTFSEAITKADTDITESFRFNIGTTF